MPRPIGGVRPFAEIGRGRVTAVYKGYHEATDRLVVLKAVRPAWSADADLVARFAREARLAARIRHPNVVAVHDAGRDEGTAYLVAEFVEGMDLGVLLERGTLPAPLAVYVLHEAARGLAAAHAEGVLHRDLKPANLLVSDAGAVKIADFGLASLAPTDLPPMGVEGDTEEVRGTLAYLAPEVVRGEAPARAADVFALGAICAEMLTGRAPFVRSAAGDTLDAVLHHDPVPALAADPRVPPALADLAADLLTKAPDERPSAAALAERLEATSASLGSAGADDLATYLRDPDAYAPPVPPSEPADAAPPSPRRAPRRVGWALGVGALVLALLIALGLRLGSDRGGAPEEASVAAQRGPRPSVPDSAVANPSSVEAGPEPTEEVPPEGPSPEETVPEETVPEVAEATEGPPSDTASGDPVPTEPEVAEPPSEAAPEPGALVVRAEPWARVRIDGEAVGTTPLGALALPAGRHAVTFENPDFPRHTVEVDVASGEEERLAVSLWDFVGRVTLVVSPWAEVAVDGVPWDTVPPQARPLVLRPGTHRLTFTHPTLGARDVTLRIAAGEARTLRVNLAEETP